MYKNKEELESFIKQFHSRAIEIAKMKYADKPHIAEYLNSEDELIIWQERDKIYMTFEVDQPYSYSCCPTEYKYYYIEFEDFFKTEEDFQNDIKEKERLKQEKIKQEELKKQEEIQNAKKQKEQDELQTLKRLLKKHGIPGNKIQD